MIVRNRFSHIPNIVVNKFIPITPLHTLLATEECPSEIVFDLKYRVKVKVKVRRDTDCNQTVLSVHPSVICIIFEYATLLLQIFLD